MADPTREPPLDLPTRRGLRPIVAVTWTAIVVVALAGIGVGLVSRNGTPDAAPVEPAEPPVTEHAITYVTDATVSSDLHRWRTCEIIDEVEPPGGCIRWSTRLPATRVVDPVLAGDAIYTTGDGAVHAVSAVIGSHRWSSSLGAAPAGPVSVDRATVVVGLADGDVVAYGADSGLELWRVDVSEGAVGVTAADHVVAAIDRQGVLTVLERASGRMRWRAETAAAPSMGSRRIADGRFRGPAPPRVVDGRVVVTERTAGAAIAYDVRTGEPVDATSAPPDAAADVPVPPWASDEAPGPVATALAGEVLLVITGDLRVVAFDLTSQERLWHADLAVTSPGAVDVVARPGTFWVTYRDVVAAFGLPARDDEPGTPDEVWEQLRRPLQLPTRRPGECPTSPFADGVYGRAAIGEHTSVAHLDDGGTVLVIPEERYRGPLLVRGAEIDGQPSLRFREVPRGDVDALRLDDRNVRYGAARHWGAEVDVPGSGCWVLQLDGLDFRDTIVFEVGGS